jgi:LysM repeat protein
MVPFIFVNIVVSATVVLAILYWWDNRQPQTELESTPVGGVSTEFETAVPDAAQTPGTSSDGQPVSTDGENTAEEADGGEGEDDGPTVHTVQAGETLGVISQQYDVPVEDIAAANDIVNINTIAVGQQLIIPIGGLPTETPEPTAEPTEEAEPTPLPTEEADEGEAIVEVTEVISPGELTDEAVRISNAGTRPLMLRDWELEEEDGQVYTFVDVTLFGSSEAGGAPSILIHTEAGQNGPSDLYWGLETPVWESGETVTLRDAEGTVQTTFVIP